MTDYEKFCLLPLKTWETPFQNDRVKNGGTFI